ncbi:hypothetical protein ACR6C2_31990 [Streptomyces sp. INA 01156]
MLPDPPDRRLWETGLRPARGRRLRRCRRDLLAVLQLAHRLRLRRHERQGVPDRAGATHAACDGAPLRRAGARTLPVYGKACAKLFVNGRLRATQCHHITE